MILKNNLKFISKKIKNNDQSCVKSNKLQFKESKDNHIVPLLNNTALHSLYYPLKEGERNNIKLEKKEICIAIGFGAGYHLTRIAEQNNKILAVCIDNKICSEILSMIDLSKYFKLENLKIIDSDEILEYFDINKYDSYKIIIHPVLERIFPNKIINIIKKISYNLNPLILEIKTQKKFGKLWFNNIIKNFKYFKENRYNFSPLIIDAKPILITGAGPSLFNNIKTIQNFKNDFFITASDTSLKILLKHDIIPDAVFSFDVQSYSYLNFTGNSKKIRIFTDFTSSIRHCGEQTILFSNHPMNNIFIKVGFSPVFLQSDTKNIGGAMINFFKAYFSDYPIVTVGIDFGYFNYYSYSRGSYLDEYKLNYSNYYNSPENIDAELYYKNIFLYPQNKWNTTSLLENYSKSLQSSNIYTLSKSPYINQIYINNLTDIITTAGSRKKTVLEFKTPKITKEDFYKLMEKEIKNNPEILKSYCLSQNINLQETDIIKILHSIKKMLF